MTSETTTLRVLIVDDHELVREGLVGAFLREDGTEVTGSVGTVAEAVAAYSADRPDVIVTDLQLQDGTGLDIIRQVRQNDEKIGLVVVTMHSGDDQIFAAMEAGASAFVGKDAPSTEVVRAARHAAVSPRSFLCTGLAGAMMRRITAESTRLSQREHDVLLLLADGSNAAAIGQQLYMSESTVKSHIARIYQKLGASNRAQALVTAMRIGLLSTRAASQRVVRRQHRIARGLSANSAICPIMTCLEWPGRTIRLGPNTGFHERHRFDMIEHGGLRPSRLSTARSHTTCRRTKMLDYLRIMLNAQKAKMDERGASAVEYGLLIAGIAALIIVVDLRLRWRAQQGLPRHLRQRRPERVRRHAAADLSHSRWPRTFGSAAICISRGIADVHARSSDAVRALVQGGHPYPPLGRARLVLFGCPGQSDPWGPESSIMRHVGFRPSRFQTPIQNHLVGETNMLDYLRIMLNAQKAKMDERGASAVEYGLLIAGIAALIIVVIFAFGGVLNKVFSDTCGSVGHQGRRRQLRPRLSLQMAADLGSAAICISRHASEPSE